MSKTDEKIQKLYENAKDAMERLSSKTYRYAGQEFIYEDIRTVQKLLDAFEEGEWYWKNFSEGEEQK